MINAGPNQVSFLHQVKSGVGDGEILPRWRRGQPKAVRYQLHYTSKENIDVMYGCCEVIRSRDERRSRSFNRFHRSLQNLNYVL